MRLAWCGVTHLKWCFLVIFWRQKRQQSYLPPTGLLMLSQRDFLRPPPNPKMVATERLESNFVMFLSSFHLITRILAYFKEARTL